MSGLPAWIAAVLKGKLEHTSRNDLRERAQAASDAYRARGSSEVIRSDLDALAYALVRMPATYAAVRASLAQTIGACPDFTPETILDVGAGPGTASWAALDMWRSLRRMAWIDRNTHLLALGRTLHGAPGAPQAELSVTAGELAQALGNAEKADVVLASYALTEIAPAQANALLSRLWELAGRLLVLIEPGTPDGFKRVFGYRTQLLALGASLVAPCSHDGVCPLADNPRWCHFGVRLPRSRDHLLIKNASVPYEDEKFIYLAAGKGFAPLARGHRVLATPKVSKTGVTFDLCAPGAVERRVIARRDKEAYKAAKRCDWGDAV